MTVLAVPTIWHTVHWVGTVLTASQFKDRGTQLAQVKNFLTAALTISNDLLIS